MKTLFFLIFVISQNLYAEKNEAPATAAKKLVVLGDSLTEGYGVAKNSSFPSLLENKLQNDKKNWRVVNAGVSGSTTASAPSRMKWILKNKPDAILLILGANDGLRGLQVEQSEKNLAEAIEVAQKANVMVILGGLYMPPNYGKDYTKKFHEMFKRLAAKYKMIMIPFILENVAGDSKLNQADGIHPNEEGHKIVAENIYTIIKGSL